jgi:hypothetical protein
MKRLWERFKEWWCRRFGHDIPDAEWLMMRLDTYADPPPKHEPYVRCYRCGCVIVFPRRG